MVNMFKNLSVLLVSFTLGTAAQLPAQTFKTLHSFTNGEGIYPSGSLVLSSNILYGTAIEGGAASNGTIFALKTDGSGVTNLHSFTSDDGVSPSGGVVLPAGVLFGTTASGGSSGNGTIFSINVDASGFKTLHMFASGSGSWPNLTNSDGAKPWGELAFSGETLYGVTESGGSNGSGTLFAINVSGTEFTNLYSFSPDASEPNSVIISGDTLYGTTYAGTNVSGTIFAIKTDGTHFTNLHSFSRTEMNGAFPFAGLTLSGKTLYGTTSAGGSNNSGTVFAINTNGTEFTILHDFNARIDGGSPESGLVLWGHTLYGTTTSGIDINKGTVFALDIDGTSFTTFYTFSGGIDGASPSGRLILSGNKLYGTTTFGGTSNNGTVFSFDVVTLLSITPYSGNLILAWPDHPSGFTLQSTTNLLSPVWDTVSSQAVLVNGQNIVIDPSAGSQRFYRLSQ